MKVYLPRIMSLSQNPRSHESERKQWKSLQSVQQAFVEKAFCIVWDEMKAKMEALGLNEEDIRIYSSRENNIAEIIEFIHQYFSQLIELRPQLLKIEKGIHGKDSVLHITIEGNDEKIDLISEWCKIQLLELLTHFKELSSLFSHFPKEWVKIITSCLERNIIFDLIIALRAWIEKYNFSWNLLIEFFEKIPRRVSVSISDQKDPIKSINLLIETYLVLWDSIKQETLFDDLIKISLSAWKENIWRILTRLETLDSEYKKYISDNYELVIKLIILAWENSMKLINSPSIISKIIWFIKKNNSNKDLIMSWLEKLWPDFIYVLNSISWFIYHILERFPERFVEFCENLKKLADYSQNNEGFYLKPLDFITQFVVDHPDKWDYLLKIWEIFWKNIPWILSIWKGFINELLKYFPDNYEEILLEVRDVWEHIHGWNEWNLLTWWLKFLAQFLEEWKEVLFKKWYELKRLNDEKLKQNHNTWWIFFEDWLDFVSRYIMHSPETKDGKWIEICERIIKIINKHYSNKDDNNGNNFLKSYMLGFGQYIWYQLIDEDNTLLDELLNFLEKVWGSKDALRLISSLAEIHSPRNLDDDYFDPTSSNWNDYFKRKLNNNAISYTLAYLLKHKKSKIIPFIQNLNLIKDLNLWININQVLLGWVSLEYKSNEELQELFAGENAESTKIWKYFIKIWWQNSEDIKGWITQIKQAKKIDKTKAMQYLVKIQNVFAESVLEYFEKIIHKKIHLKFKKEFGLSKDFDDNLLNENLFELYKMYSSTIINKAHAFELIQRYLKWEVYTGSGDILQTYPYNREENRLFLNETLKDKSHIWLSRNERTYEIEDTSKNTQEKTDNIPERIAHHLKIANEKLKLLEIKDEKWDYMTFETHWDLRKYFNLTLKKEREKYDTNLFNDLELQIKSIETLLKSNNEQRKKVSKIKIYHELEPLKIAMMGNWVEWSCLSYYSTVWNYWSAITNALEVNKWVFYIEDENGNVIARVLVWIDNNWDLEIHPMYFKWNIGINIKEIFYFQYMSELTSKLWVTKHGDRDKVQLLFCEKWYSWD